MSDIHIKESDFEKASQVLFNAVECASGSFAAGIAFSLTFPKFSPPFWGQGVGIAFGRCFISLTHQDTTTMKRFAWNIRQEFPYLQTITLLFATAIGLVMPWTGWMVGAAAGFLSSLTIDWDMTKKRQHLNDGKIFSMQSSLSEWLNFSL